jgi:ribosomal protein L32E
MKDWTAMDEENLRTYYPKHPAHEVAGLLGGRHRIQEIHEKAKALGIRRPKPCAASPGSSR